MTSRPKDTAAQHYAFSLQNTSKTVLTITKDGELQFGKDAHPQEVVDVLMKLWRETLAAAPSGEESDEHGALTRLIAENLDLDEAAHLAEDSMGEADGLCKPCGKMAHAILSAGYRRPSGRSPQAPVQP